MPYKKSYAVYLIRNLHTNQSYIGVDSRYPSRIRFHKRELLKGKHPNKYLQNSFNKYTVNSFSFKLITRCNNRKQALDIEQKCIHRVNSLNNGFNHTSGGEGSVDYTHSKETLKKMSKWKRQVNGKWLNQLEKARKNHVSGYNFKKQKHPDYSRWLGGENHPVAKLTQKDVCTIRLQYLNKIKQTDLANHYNVSKTQINYIVINKNWYDPNYFHIKRKDFTINKMNINKLKDYLNERI